jgi:hypothetical protein
MAFEFIKFLVTLFEPPVHPIFVMADLRIEIVHIFTEMFYQNLHQFETAVKILDVGNEAGSHHFHYPVKRQGSCFCHIIFVFSTCCHGIPLIMKA